MTLPVQTWSDAPPSMRVYRCSRSIAMTRASSGAPQSVTYHPCAAATAGSASASTSVVNQPRLTITS